jgi:hypothetical protein
VPQPELFKNVMGQQTLLKAAARTLIFAHKLPIAHAAHCQDKNSLK